MIALTHAYGLSREPFSPDIPVAELFPLPGIAGVPRAVHLRGL